MFPFRPLKCHLLGPFVVELIPSFSCSDRRPVWLLHMED